MRITSLAIILFSSWLVLIKAQPLHSYRLAYYNSPAKIRGQTHLDDLSSSAISEDDDYEDEYSAGSSRKTKNSATGRLFFNKLFGNGNQQPVIPIIITGAGNANANPGTGLTTASIPAATGTITTSPIAGRGQREREDGETEEESGNESIQDEELQKQQAVLQNAIAVAAQEYVAANGPIKNVEDDMSGQLNVREKDDKNKFITVRIPVKYRKYFKNGQKVYLSRPNNNNNKRRRNRNRNRRVRN